ncbi:MAG: nucleotide sugar dehydrogenase [Thermomicrobiales bacterium]
METIETKQTTATTTPASPDFARLRDAIRTREATFGVIGLGYVGLPLATSFASVGFPVLGFDLNAATVDTLNAGISHIKDVPTAAIADLVQAERFAATTDMDRLADADIISICVPTPLSKTRDPDMSYVAAATAQIARTLRPGQLIVLESTTFPGTTREVILPQLEATGLWAGEDFFLAFSPERIDPGNPTYGIVNTPKVVGGLDPQSTELACYFYEKAIETVIPVSSPEVAEMVKLHENTFRAVNIALANETALMCDKLGLNVWEVIDAAASKPFGFMPFYPGPGIGGHCIPLDPHYLAWKMKTLNYKARFIELASEINASMPQHVVNKVAAALNEHEKSVKGSNILVIGVAYKPDIDDVRESPALDIIALLQEAGANVSYHDPYVPELRVPAGMLQSQDLTPERLKVADVVVVATNHEAVDRSTIKESARAVVDTRRSFASIAAQQ